MHLSGYTLEPYFFTVLTLICELFLEVTTNLVILRLILASIDMQSFFPKTVCPWN